MVDTTSIRVRVQDLYGNPIEGALVRASPIRAPGVADPIPIGPPRTDSSGNVTWEMAAGIRYEFRTTSPDPLKYECFENCIKAIIGGETPVLTVVMKEPTVGVEMQVHVQDQYGTPVEGAAVWSSKIPYPISIGPPRTDSSGDVAVRVAAGEKWDFNTASPDPHKYECVDCSTGIIGGETPVITFVMRDLTMVEPKPGADPRTWGPADDMPVKQADAVMRAGHQVYIKCTLPILDLLPSLPYYIGLPILPGFRLTVEP